MKLAADLLWCVRSKECPVTGILRLCAGIVAALAVALLLSGCGRKGPLDPPPGSSQYQQGAPASAPGAPPQPGMHQEFDENGKPVAPAGQKKRLPLDWLLD
jgi:predicted small lipoprotein YifL